MASSSSTRSWRQAPPTPSLHATTATLRSTTCAEHFEGHYHTVHLWTIICLSMGILGPNERTYLGEDLAELLMPEVKEEE